MRGDNEETQSTRDSVINGGRLLWTYLGPDGKANLVHPQVALSIFIYDDVPLCFSLSVSSMTPAHIGCWYVAAARLPMASDFTNLSSLFDFDDSALLLFDDPALSQPCSPPPSTVSETNK